MSALYKVLSVTGSACHGGRGRWPLPKGDRHGGWLEVDGPLEPCVRGLHLCRRGHPIGWLGPAIFVAEHGGELIDAGDKVVVRRARLLRRLDAWNDRTTRPFAADCAERVLPLFEARHRGDDRPRRAIEAARAFTRGEISGHDLAAAEDAAGDAAGAAGDAARVAAWAATGDATWTARDAAKVAAWAATWAAARAATWDAAWAAAWDAAWAATVDAAWAIERAWQTERLFTYLEETDLEETERTGS
jgi:hypothetical protein